ncbi:MAG: hypothetical protein GEU92_15230 [Alphaproteobacteria bacterium]|nr:hypothetical protein [Alphaproteobacteria bacterium]
MRSNWPAGGLRCSWARRWSPGSPWDGSCAAPRPGRAPGTGTTTPGRMRGRRPPPHTQPANRQEGAMERNDRPLSELLRDLVDQLSSIIRHEIGLARAEISEKAGQAGAGVTMLAMALVLGIGAVVILLGAGVAALSNVMEPWASALIVGGAAALVAGLMAAKGKSNLKPGNLAPSRAMHSVQADTQLVKEKVR